MSYDNGVRYVAWTRYVRLNGGVVMHVWGPPQTSRSKAQVILKRVLRERDETQGHYGNETCAQLKKAGRLSYGTTEVIGSVDPDTGERETR